MTYPISYVGGSDHYTPHLWQQEPDKHWYLTDGGQVRAVLSARTTRKRVTDWSGVRQFRVSTEHTITCEYRVGRQQTVSFELYFFGGLRKALGEVLAWHKDGHLLTLACEAVWRKMSAAGLQDEDRVLRWNIGNGDGCEIEYMQAALRRLQEARQ